MHAVYVKEQGAQVGRKGGRLVISKAGKLIESIPLAQIDQLVLMGNVQLTAQAERSLLEREVDVVRLTSRGGYVSRVVGAHSPHAHLRHAQMRAFGDPTFCLTLARALITGKINNQRTILQRQTRQDATRGGGGQAARQAKLQAELAGMQRMLQMVAQATPLAQLRGYEGKAAAHYFGALRQLIDPAWGFKGRAFYPPPDAFNALLSFCYGLLRKEVLAAVYLVGLDPYLGFFHEVRYGSPVLALDMMEEWRPVVADGLALGLVNQGVLKPDDFIRTDNPRQPVLLSDNALRRVVEAHEARLEVLHFHPLAGPGGETPIRQSIVLQMRQLAQLLEGKRQTFTAFEVR